MKKNYKVVKNISAYICHFSLYFRAPRSGSVGHPLGVSGANYFKMGADDLANYLIPGANYLNAGPTIQNRGRRLGQLFHYAGQLFKNLGPIIPWNRFSFILLDFFHWPTVGQLFESRPTI